MTLAINDLTLQDLTKEIKRTMRRSAKDAVQLGYMLRRVLEEQLYQEMYDDFDTYLDKELQIDYTMATRFIKINKKFSFTGRSMELAEKYENYSQGLLIEILSMTPEQEAKVTAEMTVKQAREIKRQDRPQKPVSESEVPAAAVPAEKEVIVDGGYREIKEPETVATSQPEESAQELEKSDFPCDGCGYDHSGSCGYPTTKDDYCAMGDKRIPDGVEYPCDGCCYGTGDTCTYPGDGCVLGPEEDTEEMPTDVEEYAEYYKSINFVKHILQEEQKLLRDYLDVGELPIKTVERQRVITAALAAMVCDLENAEEDQEVQANDTDYSDVGSGRK